jgi:glycosyltransferase involved in cell wall biosynthesis
MLQPAKWLNKLGLAEVKMLPFYWKSHGYPDWKTYVRDCQDKGIEPSQGDFQKKMARVPKDPFKPPYTLIEKYSNWADIIVVMRRDLREHCAMLMAMKDLKKPVVLETDDFVHYVPPYNPGAKYYPPGSEASDIWASRQFGIVDAVVTTTPGLKKLYRQLHPKIYVCPNMLDPDYWVDKYPKPKPHPGEVRIGWTGANAHWGDLRILKDVIPKILDKYPQVKFHFIGQLPDWWYDLRRKGRVVQHKFKTLHYYGEFIYSLGYDIGVAPLLDNLFNRGKSQIRWMEYAVSKAAVVASPIWAYNKDPFGKAKHNKNLLFAKERDEWFNQLSKLIEDEKLRKKIGNQAYKDVITHYNLEKQAKVYSDVYEKIYDNFHYKPSN